MSLFDKVKQTVLLPSVLCLSLLFPAFFVSSQQISFHKDALLYQYQWLDKNKGEIRELQFHLNSSSFTLSKFKAYKPANNQAFIERKLKLHAKSYDPKSVQFRFTKRNNQLDLQIKTTDAKLMGKLQKEFKQVRRDAETQFLHDHYYIRFTDSYGNAVIKPDHQRMVKESLRGLQPVSDAFIELSKGHAQRRLLELVLSFVQSIPYAQMQSNDGLRGAGYIPPGQLIANNRGDCDSKSALLIGILKNIFPDMPIALIFVPGHALVGVNVAAKSSDKTVTLNGTRFVLIEPTGPAQRPFGSVSKLSTHFIDSHLLQYELY